jgi:dephospho-CoA kinase
MLRVGLTGGLASGKSFVGSALESLGCRVIRADQLGHQVLARDGEAYADVVAAFGSGILAEDGGIDRRKLAAEVFGHPERLQLLNSLVHPWVVRREERAMEEFARTEPHGIAVVEAAILIETGSHRRFDWLIVVVCSPEEQVRRAMKRDHLTREEVEARLRHQLPLVEKKKYADFVIDTSGEKEETLRQVRAVYEALRSLAQ